MTSEENNNRCQKCGATLHRSPDTGELTCLLCSYEPVHEVEDSQIEMVIDPVEEYRRIRREEQQMNDFIYGLNSSVKDLYVTKILIAINIGVFLYMGMKGVNLYNPDEANLKALGGNFSSATMFGEPWRLFTCMFLHGGIIHLAMNMFFFWVLGKFIEKIFGHTNYLLLYIFSGLLGSLCSVVFNPHVVSVGASGALFGIFGALAGYLFMCKKYIPPRLFQEIKSNVVMTLGLNIIFGLSVPNIDMAAHMGGLAGGFIAAIFLSHDLSPGGMATRKKRGMVFSVIALLILLSSYFVIKSQFKKPFETTYERFHEIDVYFADKLTEKINDARNELIDKITLLEFIDKLLIDWQKIRKDFNELKPFGFSNKIYDKIGKYMALKEERLRLMIKTIEEETDKYDQRIKEIDAELEPYVKN